MLRSESDCTDPITEVCLSEDFKCTSSEVVSSVFDDIGRGIEEGGLKRFEIEYFQDRNSLEAWPLSQIVCKAVNCEHVRIANLSRTTENNRIVLVDFVAQICSVSVCLKTLSLCRTASSVESGIEVFQTLADGDLSTLEQITLNHETLWFGGRSECLDLLLVALARQQNLRKLNVKENGFTQDQQE